MKGTIRLFAVLLFAAACTASLAAGGSRDTEGPAGGPAAASPAQTAGSTASVNPREGQALPIFDKKVTLKIMTREMDIVPVKQDWLTLQKLEEKTNVHLDIMAVPQGSYQEKKEILLNTGEIPDLMVVYTSEAKRFGPMGAFLGMDKYLDMMPNMQKQFQDYPDALPDARAYDGELYNLPFIKKHSQANGGVYIRGDIFKANNLAIPTNFDELYTALKKLKEIYPDSSPWIQRVGVDYLTYMMAPSWGTGCNVTSGAYYNRETGKWQYGYTEDRFRDMLKFINRCYTEKLLDNEFAIASAVQWKQKLFSGKGFFTYDYFQAANKFQQMMRADDPSVTLQLILPPVAPGGKAQVWRSPDVAGEGIGVRAGIQNPELVMRYLDYWLYSEETFDLFNWGVEGVTYTVGADGKKKLMKDMQTLKTEYGVQAPSLVGTEDGDVTLSEVFSPDKIAALKWYRANDAFRSPDPVLSFNEAQQQVDNRLGASLEEFAKQEILKFITGAKSFDQWNDFVAQIKSKGVDEYLKIFNEAQPKK